MKFQVGDRVLVLHSEEEGEVVEIINDKMVLVEVKTVQFPAYIDQLDFPYFKRFTEKKLFPASKAKQYVDDVKRDKVKETRVEDGVWLVFLPVVSQDEFGDEVVDSLKLHLHNRTRDTYQFVYHQTVATRAVFELKNTVHPFEDFYLHDVDFEDMNDNPSFDFDFSLPTPVKGKANHYEASVKLRAKQLFTKIETLRKNNEPTFSYQLFETYPNQVAEDRLELGSLAARGYKIYDASRARQHLEPARSVVDLHIEKLQDDWRHLDNFEILTIQLTTFEKYYELALAHHLPSLIVIHGVGTGKLRDEIHAILRLKKEVKSFVNQYDQRFGYGATEVFFQY